MSAAAEAVFAAQRGYAPKSEIETLEFLSAILEEGRDRLGAASEAISSHEKPPELRLEAVQPGKERKPKQEPRGGRQSAVDEL